MGKPLRILFDGWSLIYQPTNPEALHLLELLTHCPGGCEPHLALPAESKYVVGLPGTVHQVLEPCKNTPAGRLRWEQRTLPRLARLYQADLVHLTTLTPPLFSRQPVVISPAGFEPEAHSIEGGLASRLRHAFGHGALQRVAAVFWPVGLPQPSYPAQIIPLPGLVGPDFNPNEMPDQSIQQSLGLPESYLIYHGPQDRSTLQRLLATWSWAAGSIGELYPLVAVGFQQAQARRDLLEMARAAKLDDSLVVLPELHAGALPSLYRGCAGLLHFGEVSAWGGPVRYALACGKPVICDETQNADIFVGPAGYLFPRAETRRRGAALLSVVVNPEVAESLRGAALKQAASWQSELFPEKLLQAYLQVLGIGPGL